MEKEYTYDIGKYTIGVDENGKDEIGLTIAKIEDNGIIHFLGNCYGENARCLDLLIKENQELKKRLETYEIEGYKQNEELDKMSFDVRKYKLQQKEFIKYLEDEIKQNTPSLRWKHYNEDGFNDYDVENPNCIEMRPTDKVLKEILQKYKSIIGGSDEKK